MSSTFEGIDAVKDALRGHIKPSALYKRTRLPRAIGGDGRLQPFSRTTGHDGQVHLKNSTFHDICCYAGLCRDVSENLPHKPARWQAPQEFPAAFALYSWAGSYDVGPAAHRHQSNDRKQPSYSCNGTLARSSPPPPPPPPLRGEHLSPAYRSFFSACREAFYRSTSPGYAVDCCSGCKVAL